MAMILLVDDDRVERKLFRRMLESGGLEVLEAADAAEACRLFDQAASEVAALVTDLRMPVIDGCTLANRLIAMRPALPVLFISGVVDGSLVDELETHLDRFAFLAKPFGREVLLGKIGRMLEAAA